MTPRYARIPLLLSPDAPPIFPDAEHCDDEGLLAVGGDLSSARLLAAYDSGVFPWYNDGLPVLWWSPNPRAVLFPPKLQVSRSMHRVIRRHPWQLTWNRAFERVMQECGEQRPEGTWIVDDMLEAYVGLHQRGHAHSLEVWDGSQLVGGIYGVQRGGLFAAESMFHRRSNASKLALIALTRSLEAAGIELIDVQFLTPHLASLGVEEITRSRYIAHVRRLKPRSPDLTGLKLLPTGIKASVTIKT